MTQVQKERAIAAHGGIVRRVAWQVREMAPKHWEFEDLVGYGWVAFLRALERYRAGRDRGAGLGAYLSVKVRFELLDRLREIDHPRRLGLKPVLLHLPVQIPESSRIGELIAAREVWEVIERLPERWARLMRLRYGEELTFRECGAALGVNESRACQIHGQAVAMVRKMVGELTH